MVQSCCLPRLGVNRRKAIVLLERRPPRQGSSEEGATWGLFLCFQMFPETWGVAAEPTGYQREHDPQSPAVLQRCHGTWPQLVQGNRRREWAGLPATASGCWPVLMRHRRASVAWSGTVSLILWVPRSSQRSNWYRKIERFFHLKKLYYTMSMYMAVEMLSSFYSFFSGNIVASQCYISFCVHWSESAMCVYTSPSCWTSSHPLPL